MVVEAILSLLCMNIFTRPMWASVTGDPHCTGVQGDNSEQSGPAAPSPAGAVGPLR